MAKKRVAKRRFASKVRRALPQRLRSSPPKWHIYRTTAVINPEDEGAGGPVTTSTGQTAVDIAHGLSTHYDGIVALQAVAKMNMKFSTTLYPNKPIGKVHIYKSYMVLYMTNNSATPVYGKMAVCRPRKGINTQQVSPSSLASFDLQGPVNNVPNEYVGQDIYLNASLPNTYSGSVGMTDRVFPPVGITDIGFIWQNSPAFKSMYKIKMKEITWAPMECKQFRFKMRKNVSVDIASEYTLSPATTASSLPRPFLDDPTYYLNAKDTGMSVMGRGRGFFLSFLLHGIPARSEDNLSVGLTQPKFDLFWLNAYKYGWQDPNYREFHVNQNPLESEVPSVAIPGFGTVPGPPQLGGD